MEETKRRNPIKTNVSANVKLLQTKKYVDEKVLEGYSFIPVKEEPEEMEDAPLEAPKKKIIKPKTLK